ncbi:MAG: ribosome maturation factor RimM [Candidatus Competibacterales bacterium]|nr:ribosome maturation factor RimM [Candidatus Competibacterales bacterium]
MDRDWVTVGRIGGLFGVRGWVKLISHTTDRTDLLDYRPLYLNGPDGRQALELEAGRAHGRGLIAKFAGIDSRDQAAALVGRDLAVRRDQLPSAAPGEYYWTDLEGLRVLTRDGTELGMIDHLFATGANDVMVVRGTREHLLPLLFDRVVVDVDLEARTMRVDWDPEF